MQENKRYLRTQVNPILELLIAELMKEKPDKPISFMRDWLRKEGPNIQQKIEVRLRTRPEGLKTTSESNNEEEEKDTVVTAPEPAKPAAVRPARTSVSAEVYGEYNRKKPFIPPVHQKTADQRLRIMQKIAKSFLFSNLDQKDQEIIVNAMEIVNFNSGARVITQGEKGDHLYVVDSGILDCSKTDENGVKKHLVTYGPGDAFGELALLYNAPRAATIDARTSSTLLALDRETFNNVVKEAVIKRRQLYEEFLRKIELFDSLNTYEKDKICDCLQSKVYQDGEFIIKEGEEGNTFYCIQKGKCKAYKLNPNTGKQDLVMEYHENEYFGELAILRDVPRAASVAAAGPVEVAYLDRASFKRLFGPLEEILKRNSRRYQTYVLQK